jgi:hypothetical protein
MCHREMNPEPRIGVAVGGLLFVAEGDHGIDAHGTAGGDVSRDKSDGHEYENSERKS